MEKGENRVAPSPSEGQIKNNITDDPSYETRSANVSSKSVKEPMFVSAAEIAAKAHVTVQPINELSDEEFLAMAIKFEKEHPQ